MIPDKTMTRIEKIIVATDVYFLMCLMLNLMVSRERGSSSSNFSILIIECKLPAADLNTHQNSLWFLDFISLVDFVRVCLGGCFQFHEDGVCLLASFPLFKGISYRISRGSLIKGCFSLS